MVIKALRDGCLVMSFRITRNGQKSENCDQSVINFCGEYGENNFNYMRKCKCC